MLWGTIVHKLYALTEAILGGIEHFFTFLGVGNGKKSKKPLGVLIAAGILIVVPVVLRILDFGTTEVPNVVGLELGNALQTMQENKLDVEVSPEDSEMGDRVERQSIGAGESVKKGTSVQLFTSHTAGPDTAESMTTDKSEDAPDMTEEYPPQEGPILDDAFSAITDTHSGGGVGGECSFRAWNAASDEDLTANPHADLPGYFISFSNLFSSIDPSTLLSDSDRIVFDLTFRLKDDIAPEVKSLAFTGSVVAENGTKDSAAYADVLILVDGVTVWESGDITGDTISAVPFSIGLSDVGLEIVIRISCMPSGKGLSLGLVDLRLSDPEDNSPTDDSLSTGPSRDVELLANSYSKVVENSVGGEYAVAGWDPAKNADMRGENYLGNQNFQLFMRASNTFNELGSSGTSTTVLEVHLIFNPKKDVDGLVWTGLIVAEKGTNGSPAYADVTISIDGVTVWATDESITGETILPVEYRIDLSDAKTEAVVTVTFTPLGNGLGIGFVDTQFEYEEQD